MDASFMNRRSSFRDPNIKGLAAKFADHVEESDLITPVFLAFFGAFIISLFIMYGDYMTTYQGYMEYPTRKYGTVIPYFIAAAPMLGQIVFVYVWGAGGGLLAFLAALGCHAFDVGFDIYYKVDGSNFDWSGLLHLTGSGSLWLKLLWALIESELVFQLLSEGFFLVSVSTIPILWPHFKKKIFDRAPSSRSARVPMRAQPRSHNVRPAQMTTPVRGYSTTRRGSHAPLPNESDGGDDHFTFPPVSQ